jgi:EsV-1-7 cysteine-rich motif
MLKTASSGRCVQCIFFKLILRYSNIPTMGRRCKDVDCRKRASYGVDWMKPTYCKSHATDKMSNVVGKRCESNSCNKHPVYGLQPKKPTHCKKHASAEMKDVINKRCTFTNCDTLPAYGVIWKRPTRCQNHASNGMTNVVSRRCVTTDCDTRPTFGLESKKPTHCKEHATEKMNDVISKLCSIVDCDTQPSYGVELNKPTHCKDHSSSDMKDVKNKRCTVTDCYTLSLFGITLKKPTHCKEHATEKMFDVINKRCKTCESTSMNQKYKPNCFYLNPDDPRIRNYKTKEQAFMSPLQGKYPEMILDRIVIGGCSKRRPDGLLRFSTHSVVIEIDEDQHVGYESICDNKRTMELFQDLGNRPIVFVRLNPDSYKLAEKRIKGVFSVSKGGTMTQNKKEFSRRYDSLLEAVKSAISTVPTKTVSSVKLYYSE